MLSIWTSLQICHLVKSYYMLQIEMSFIRLSTEWPSENGSLDRLQTSKIPNVH